MVRPQSCPLVKAREETNFRAQNRHREKEKTFLLPEPPSSSHLGGFSSSESRGRGSTLREINGPLRERVDLFWPPADLNYLLLIITSALLLQSLEPTGKYEHVKLLMDIYSQRISNVMACEKFGRK